MGGIEGQILRLAHELRERHLLDSLLVTTSLQCALAMEFRNAGFEVVGGLMRYRDLRGLARFVADMAKNNDVTAIQSHAVLESFIGREAKRIGCCVPHIFRAHTYIDQARIPGWRKQLYHWLDRVTSRYVDVYLANGQYLAREITDMSRVAPGKITVVLNGRQSLGAPDVLEESDAPLPRRIAMIANIIRGKGHDVLVEALGHLKRRGIIVQAKVLGAESNNLIDSGGASQEECSVLERVQARAVELGVLRQIELATFTRNVRGALQGIPVVVLPSDSEGVPNSILEAMSLRKLIVASAVGGIPELIVDGRDGLLHPPRDAEAFAAVLQRVFSAPVSAWNCMRESAYRSWRTRFTMERMVAQFEDVYRALGVVGA